ncbi:MAG TPA: alpha/beta fold hydrolase [Bdellovibrionota bacterium]|nr:alpha/beta fold hydrolase [Bdellovibrionota bacterium]
MNREDLSGHVEWDDLGPRTITFPKLELRIRRFADSIPFVAHIRKIKEPKRTLRYRSDDPVGKERNLSFRSKDGTRLWGTLEVPKGGTKLPTAILLHGSGQETRDSGSGFEERDLNVIQARPFRELSRKLIRHGIGVFRYDKRGVGKSGGNWKEVSRTNLLEDVIAATECVADRMKGKPVILVGFSEGANLAISAALKSRQIRGVVLAGARAHSLDRVILNKTLFKARRMKRPGAETRSEIARLRRIFQYVRSLHSKTGGKIKNVPWMGKSLALWSEQISNVPALEAKNLRIPVLLLHGEEDAEILVEECAAMAASLSKSHVPYEVHRFKGLNHFFTKACRDFPGFEYDVPYEMSDEIPDRIATWLRKISK